MSAQQNFWLERDLSSQATLNKKIAISKTATGSNSSSGGGDCWLFHENNAYYITDLQTKLLAIINQRHIHKVRFLTTGTAQKRLNNNPVAGKKPATSFSKLARINLKIYSYSSMSSFLNQTPSSTRNSLVKNRPLTATSTASGSNSSNRHVRY
jgi:hypothetical protein